MRSNSTNKDLKGFHGLIKIKIRADFFQVNIWQRCLVNLQKNTEKKKKRKKERKGENKKEK